MLISGCEAVDRDEVDRLRKRFMKLDKVRNLLLLRSLWYIGCEVWEEGGVLDQLGLMEVMFVG